jgi:type II secretory pathway pseudopilin PulG
MWGRTLYRHASGARGFTATELVATLAGVTVLTAVAVPVMQAQLAAFNLSGATRQVAGDLMRTRMRAVGENATYRVVYSSTQYQLEKDVAGVFVPQGGPILVPDGIALSLKSKGNVTFRPSGWVETDTPLSVLITNAEGATKEVTISFGGQVEIVESAG